MLEEIEEESKVSIRDLLTQYVNKTEFMITLTTTIDAVTNEANKAKLMLEVLSYVEPKIKAMDKDDTGNMEGIIINFIEAHPPEDDDSE